MDNLKTKGNTSISVALKKISTVLFETLSFDPDLDCHSKCSKLMSQCPPTNVVGLKAHFLKNKTFREDG